MVTIQRRWCYYCNRKWYLRLPTRNLLLVTHFRFSYLVVLLHGKGNPLDEHCFGGDGGHSLSEMVKLFYQACVFLQWKEPMGRKRRRSVSWWWKNRVYILDLGEQFSLFKFWPTRALIQFSTFFKLWIKIKYYMGSVSKMIPLFVSKYHFR